MLAVILAIVVNVAFVSAVDDAVDQATNSTVETPAGSVDGGSEDEAVADDQASEEIGTTRDNPAPLGSAVTGGDWTVTVNSVKTADSDSLDQTPAKGSTLLVVNLTATYNGDDDQGATPWATIKFVTVDGNTLDSTDGSTLFIPEEQFDSLSTVYSGASVRGDKIIEVPSENWTDGVLAVSPDILSDDTFVALR